MTEQIERYEAPQEIAIPQAGVGDPALGVALVKRRWQALQQALKEVLIPGVDYDPETKALRKPGAEKLAAMFGLSPTFRIVEKVEDWERGFFYYHYRCSLVDASGRVVAEGDGSANSMEARYRWRWVPEWKATDEDRAAATATRKGRNRYGEYVEYRVPNPDPYTLVNTLQKQAQKRALVAAVLMATGASGLFTQDVDEWDDEAKAEVVARRARRPASRPASRPAPHQAPSGPGPGDFWPRVYSLDLPRDQAQRFGLWLLDQVGGDFAEALQVLQERLDEALQDWRASEAPPEAEVE